MTGTAWLILAVAASAIAIVVAAFVWGRGTGETAATYELLTMNALRPQA